MNVSSTMAVAILSLLGAALWAPPALSADGPRLIRPLGKRPPPRCVEGYVWREAYAGDVVCVDPPRRDAVHTENAMAAQRVEPGGGAYGPDTCRSGYVWREARAADHVCVTPDSRSTVAGENQRAPQLWVRTAACGTPQQCQQQAERKRAEAEQLRRKIAQRKHDLAKAKEEQRRAEEQRRKDDEAWARAHPGLGRTQQPISTDNVVAIEQDIQAMEKALAEAEQQAANSGAHSP